jgi:hypothetical protein
MNKKINPISAALLEALRSIGYTLDTALADIIDNSITAKAGNISVNFLWNNGKPWIAVCDDGGGMTREELVEAMKFGSKSPIEKRDSEDLGRFGLGMKTASISQCRRMTVVSSHKGETSACEWNLNCLASDDGAVCETLLLKDNAVSKNTILSELVPRSFIKGKSGTIVLWRDLDPGLGDPKESTGEQRFSAQMDIARKHLELVFHRFLSPSLGQRKISIDFNDTPLEAFNPFGPSVPARQELTAEKISVQGHVIVVQPYVLPHHSKAGSIAEYQKYAGEEGYLQNQGFYIYRNKRLIIKATWFRLIPKDELNKLIRIRVDIPNALDDMWRIDVKKSQANPPEIVRRELKRIIKKISGAGRIVFTNRATRLQHRTINPVWAREVEGGQIKYKVNEGHPLLKALLKDIPKAQSDSLHACLELINSTFPYDMYYADAADDKTEFAESAPEEETVRQVGIQLVRALRSCGFEGADLRKQLEGAEFFKCSAQMLEEILSLKGAA